MNDQRPITSGQLPTTSNQLPARSCVLTLIVPAYDMERWLDACLASLAPMEGERLPPYEVLVVNDGSRDRTSEIAHEWQRRHPNVFRVIDKANGHYGSCVNVALAAAKGTYVKVLDADDAFCHAMFADYLELLAKLATRANVPDVVVNDEEWVAADGTSMHVRRYGLPDEFDMTHLLACAQTITIHALAYRTDLLRQMDYCQTEGIPYTDTEWFTLPMVQVRSGVHFGHTLYRYSIQRPGQSIEAAAYARDVDALVKVFDRMRAAYRDDKVARAATNSAYLLEQLKRLALVIGSVCVYNLPTKRTTEVLAPFLEKVSADLPEVMTALDAACVFSWSPLPLHHLRFWRRHPRLRRPLLVLLHAYVRLLPSYRG